MTATRDDTIADLKRANAELRHERDAALAREAALAEVLDVINRSPGEPGPVFEAILDRAHRLCGAVSGSLQLYDGEAFHAVAAHGLPEPFAEWLRSRRLATADGPFSPLIEGQSSHHILDLAQLDHPAARKAVEETGSRTLLAVALRADQKLLGMILTVRNEIRAFSHQEIVLLESFADQAVIAVENARLVTEQREALEQQTATAEVLQVINASPGNLTRVFETMLDKAMQLCETSAGIFTTYDGAQLKTEAMRGLPTVYAEFRANNPLTFAPGQATSRLRDGRSVLHITDLKAEDIYKSADLHRRALVDLGGARTALLVALRKDDVWLGTFLIYRQEVRPFSDRQVALLQNFAAQAVIAMENARLLAELRARTDELAQRQNELRVTFENMADGVAMFDETPRLVAWNRKFQEIFDVPDGLLEERRTYAEYIRYLAERGDYGPGTDVEGQVRLITANAAQRRTYERNRPDGRVVEIRNNPVMGGSFVLIFSDITERKRSEAEIRVARDAAETALRELKAAQANLIQAEKMASLGQLTAGIAHEIKNPLNFVNNFAGLSVELLDELKEAAAPALAQLDADSRADVEDLTRTLASNLEKINEHGKRADGIVRSMLEHSRGSSGERRAVDLNTLVEEALNLAYHGARAQDQGFNITLERDFGSHIAPIELTPQDIMRALLNLFSNGFYATTRRARNDPGSVYEPALKVTTLDLGKTVEIRVRDNGIGIAAEIREKVFQPFFTTKPTGEGTGLGLSISYDIVTQQHSGSITVGSRVGEYSEFTIRLPRNP